MTTNRHETYTLNREIITDGEALAYQESLDNFINQSRSGALVRGPLRVNRNVLLDWFKRFRILPGRAVVVLLDGRVNGVLYEGSHHALSFPLNQRLDLYIVDTRERTLNVCTSQELVTFNYPSEKEAPFAVHVDLNVAVTYQVINPARVALDIAEPVTKLYDAVVESMVSVAAQTAYSDFLISGMLGMAITQQLHGRNIADYAGINVLMVQITGRHGSDALDQLSIDSHILRETKRRKRDEWLLREQTRIQIELMDAAHRRDVARLIDLTPQYIAKFMPELYPLLFGNREHLDHQRLDVLVQVIREGLLPAPAQQAIWTMLGLDPQSSGSTPPAQLGTACPGTPAGRARIESDVAMLCRAGIHITMAQDQEMVYIQAQLRDARTELQIYFACTNDYPAQPPRMWLTVDGAERPFIPQVLQQWNAQQSLKTLIDAVQGAYPILSKRLSEKGGV